MVEHSGEKDEVLRTLVAKWRTASDALAFTGDMYDGGEDEAMDAESKVYRECADALASLLPPVLPDGAES